DVLDAVAAAAAKWNLAVGDRLGMHVGLEDAVWRGVRAHPDVAAADRHAARVLRLGRDRLEQLAVPVDEARVIGSLLADPQAVLRRGDRVGVAVRALEQRRRFRLADLQRRRRRAARLRAREPGTDQ